MADHRHWGYLILLAGQSARLGRESLRGFGERRFGLRSGANAPSHTLASKPTTDSNYSTLGTVASHSHHTAVSFSPTLLRVPPTLLSHRIPPLLCLALFLLLRRRCCNLRGMSSLPCLHDNHHCPLSLSVLPPADRRVSHEGSVLLQALYVPHHMSCYAGACECSPENIR